MVTEFGYKHFALPNGLQVILYPMKSVMSVHLLLYVRVGALFEKYEEQGISHFTEHAAFLGTKKYPNVRTLAEMEERIGAIFNASTSSDKTYYFMKVPHTHIEKALGLLYEYVFCPIAAEQELIKERGVILSEFNDFWHTPEKRFIFESWKRRFKMEGHPYSYRPLGRPETINTFDRKKVLAWRERYYHPSNMTLGIAGNIDLKKIKKIIESFFGQDKEGKKHEEPVFDSNGYSSFSFHHMEDKRPQISFYLSFPAFGWRNENRHERSVLWLLNTLLAGSRTSRLYMRLREREGSVYHVGGNYSLNSYLGVEEITGSTPIEKLIFTLRALREEIDNLLNNSIADKELERAKQLISSKILMGFDNPEGANSYFTPQVFYEEEVWTPERQIKDIEKVTKEEVNKWTKKILDYSRVNINLLGNVPDKSKADIEKIFR